MKYSKESDVILQILKNERCLSVNLLSVLPF